jgi:MFS transporter, UMF1 family
VSSAAMADYGNLRKRMLIGTAFAGSLLTAAYIFLSDYKAYWLGGLLLIITNVLFGYSVIFYNAFLPQLVRSSKEYLSAPRSERLKVFDEVGNHMSTRGFMVGYAGAVFLLVVTVPIVFLVQGEVRPFWECKVGSDPIHIVDKTDATFAYRITALLTGIWWFAFTWFTFFWVKPRPGPQLPAGQNYITVSLKSVAETVRHVKKLPNTMLFLVAYFLFSDGYTTVSSVGVLFATQEMNVQSYVLGIMYVLRHNPASPTIFTYSLPRLVVVPFAALIGNWVWLKIKNRFNFETKKMIMFTIVCMLFLPVYACLGFIDSSPIGLKQTWELYVFAAWYGFNVGAIQSFTRTTYMALTPPGHESEFFGLFELTDKGSSWIGPAVVSALVQATGSLRYGNIWLIISFIIPLGMLVFVNVDKGVHDAKNFADIKSGGYPRRNSVEISELEEREVTL